MDRELSSVTAPAEGNNIKEKLAEIKEADIIIGIPSYNNAKTIGHVVRAVQAGLAKYFSDKKNCSH